MELTTQNIEIVAFLGLIALFEACERLWPAQVVDRRRDLRLDLLSFGCALAFNRLSTHAVDTLAAGLVPEVLVPWRRALASLPALWRILMAIVLVDFLLYWIHRAQHRNALLWRTHAWHHSIEQMYWFAGFRTSLLHSFIYNVPQVLVPTMLLALSPLEAGLGFAVGLFIQFWEHTNLTVDIGPLRHVLITPDYHRIHHAATDRRGMNLAPTLRVWDRLFGTYVDPATMPDAFAMGLGQRVRAREVPRMLLGV
jgi:sterol desaturase/sphingolipid hydroxylase (fatty acid hydroxylase superfamily)